MAQRWSDLSLKEEKRFMQKEDKKKINLNDSSPSLRMFPALYACSELMCRVCCVFMDACEKEKNDLFTLVPFCIERC